MKYRTLGRSGLRVSELCLGTMTFGEEWGWGASEQESKKILDSYVDAGGNFIDTANSYTGGTSERLVGSFIASDRDRFVLATKYTHFNREGDVNSGGNHRKSLVQSVEASLSRLQTEYIDLLWLHAWDFLTPVEEIMRALDDLVRTGKILCVGISNTPAWIVSQANTLASLHGWSPFIGLQVEYSLIQRSTERELLPMAEALGLGVTAWGPLSAGLLTGKYGEESEKQPAGRIHVARDMYGELLSPENLRIAKQVRQVAERLERPASAVAINWIRQMHKGLIPIIGVREVKQLEENLECLEFEISDPDLEELDEASAIKSRYPHDFLASDAVRYLTYSNRHSAIEF